jgi:hypothetical protein
MKIYTFLTDSHRSLFDIFIKNFPFSDNIELVVKWMPQECKTGSFMAEGWNSTMKRKVDYVLQSLEETPDNEWFVHADCDIVLFKGWDAILQDQIKNDLDMIFQNDYDLLCAGFFFCKRTDKTKKLWQNLRDNLNRFSNDQIGLNYLIAQANDLNIGVLPPEYFTYGSFRRGVWTGEEFTIPNAANLKMAHANYTEGVVNKIDLINKIIDQKSKAYDFRHLRPYPPRYPAYPPYSEVSQYMEHSFFNYFNSNPDLFKATDRVYIPAFWTTLYNDHVSIDVQAYLDQLPQDGKYFTVNQHDDGIRYNLPKDTMVFSASENGQGQIVHIPLLTSPIPGNAGICQKDIFCSFVGTITHPTRSALYEKYKDNKDFYFSKPRGWTPTITDAQFDEFKRVTQRSKFSLCPRGNIIQSFRIYEVLQLNSVPVIISDRFTYPFKQFVNWDEFSIIVNDINDLDAKLKSISDAEYLRLLSKGQEVYQQYFTLEKMCLGIRNILCV